MDARPLRLEGFTLLAQTMVSVSPTFPSGPSNVPVKNSLSLPLDVFMTSARDGFSPFDFRPLKRHLRRRTPKGAFPNAKDRFKD
jgi:hypothetical protein